MPPLRSVVHATSGVGTHSDDSHVITAELLGMEGQIDLMATPVKGRSGKENVRPIKISLPVLLTRATGSCRRSHREDGPKEAAAASLTTHVSDDENQRREE